jgi:hypothetical protein
VRIGLLTTSFPRFEGDYAGCFVADRARALAADGHTVDVLAAGDPVADVSCRAAPGVDLTRIAQVAIVPPPLFYGPGAPERLERGGVGAWLDAMRFSIALAATARERAARWDAIECHWLLPCALAALAAAPGLPIRAFAHSGDVALLERRWDRRWLGGSRAARPSSAS